MHRSNLITRHRYIAVLFWETSRKPVTMAKERRLGSLKRDSKCFPTCWDEIDTIHQASSCPNATRTISRGHQIPYIGRMKPSRRQDICYGNESITPTSFSILHEIYTAPSVMSSWASRAIKGTAGQKSVASTRRG